MALQEVCAKAEEITCFISVADVVPSASPLGVAMRVQGIEEADCRLCQVHGELVPGVSSRPWPGILQLSHSIAYFPKQSHHVADVGFPCLLHTTDTCASAAYRPS